MARSGSVDHIRQAGIPDGCVEVVAQGLDCGQEITSDRISRRTNECPDPRPKMGAMLQALDVFEEALLAGMQGLVHGEDDVEDARQQGRQPVLHADGIVARDGKLDLVPV